jgi:hypothetical protein
MGPILGLINLIMTLKLNYTEIHKKKMYVTQNMIRMPNLFFTKF